MSPHSDAYSCFSSQYRMSESTRPMCSTPWICRAEAIIDMLAPAMIAFEHIFSGVDAAGDGEVDVEMAVEDGGPMETGQQF